MKTNRKLFEKIVKTATDTAAKDVSCGNCLNFSGDF